MSSAGITFEAPTLDVSFPKRLKMHVIYDNELEMLSRGGKDVLLEWALGAAGAALGLSQNLGRAIGAVFAGQAPDAMDFVLALVFAVLAATAVICYRQSGGLRSDIDNLVKEIRERRGGKSRDADARLEEMLR